MRVLALSVTCSGYIYELDPLLVEEATCTRAVLSTLLDDLAHQGHLLVRHNIGTEPTDNSDSGAVTLASHGKRRRGHLPIQEQEKDSTSTRQQATRVPFQANLVNAVKLHPDRLPLPVSLAPEDDHAHTHQCCDYSISQAAEQSGESQHVLTKLHVYGMEGKRRNFFFLQNVSRPSNPPDEVAQNVSKKNPRRTNYSSIFLQKFRI